MVVTAISVSIAAVGLYDFGSSALWMREIARPQPQVTDLAQRFWTKFGLAAVLGVIASCVVAIGHGGAWLYPVVWLAVASNASLSLQAFARGHLRADLTAVATVTERTINIIAMMALLWAGYPALYGLPVALLVGSLGGLLVLWWVLPAPLHPAPPTRTIRFPWTGAGHFGAASIAVSLQTFDVAVLNTFGGAGAAGVYGSVSRWTQPMAMLSNAFTSTASAFFASAPSAREAVARARRASWLLLAATAGSVVVAILSPWLVPLLLGDDYVSSVAVLQLLAVGTAMAVWSQPTAALLQARGHDQRVAMVRLSASIAFLVSIAVVAPTAGAVGAAWSFVGLQMVNLTALALLVLHLMRRRAGDSHVLAVKE